MSSQYYHPDTDFFRKLDAPLPVATGHQIADTLQNPISEQMRKSTTRNWRMEGNQLLCDTEHGKVVQTIPTDYICTGTDSDNKPILQKIVL
jgi:hypothetical protein